MDFVICSLIWSVYQKQTNTHKNTKNFVSVCLRNFFPVSVKHPDGWKKLFGIPSSSSWANYSREKGIDSLPLKVLCPYTHTHSYKHTHNVSILMWLFWFIFIQMRTKNENKIKIKSQTQTVDSMMFSRWQLQIISSSSSLNNNVITKWNFSFFPHSSLINPLP